MTEAKTLKDLCIKIGACLYMIFVTIAVSYYISKLYMPNLWDNERVAITVFISLGFLVSLIVLVFNEKNIIKLMISYHFIIVAMVVCVLVKYPFTPFVFAPVLFTIIYDIKVGMAVGVTIGCTLMFRNNDLYPIYMFGAAPMVISVASCLCVWKKNKLIENIGRIIIFLTTIIIYVAFFGLYSKESGTMYETAGFAFSIVLTAIIAAVLGNVVGMGVNWITGKVIPSFYLKRFTDDTYPAVILMKKKSTTLYYHSMEVAELSRYAAKRIGADYELAYTGAFYHDIGKLVGQEYIKEGITLSEKYKLPQCVRNIMIEHNIKSRLPRTKESAIVMLCDTAVSAVEYLKATMDKKDMSESAIIENALNKRMLSGALNKSGLSIEEFSIVKESLLKIKEKQ